MSDAADPAKCGSKRTIIERDVLNFRPEEKRAPQLTAQIDRIDGDFLFGNARLPLLAPGLVPPFRSR